MQTNKAVMIKISAIVLIIFQVFNVIMAEKVEIFSFDFKSTISNHVLIELANALPLHH